MPVALVSSSVSSENAYRNALTIPVPTGAAAGYLALACLSLWESTVPTVSPPLGFTELATVTSGWQRTKVFWKRLTGADSGSYSFAWTSSQWSDGQAILISGARSTGDPIGTQYASSTGDSASISSITVTSVGQPFLAHFVTTENECTSTPPTDFTEVRDTPYNRISIRIPATTGSHTASGATLSTATVHSALLLAVEPESGGASARTTDFMSIFV